MSSGNKNLKGVSRDAILYLGQLRQNESVLEEHAKGLAKSNRCHLRLVFSEMVGEWTPLHAFVLKGSRKLVKIALKVGVDPNLRMGRPEGLPGGCSPLHLAAHRGDVSLITLLTSQGADVTLADDRGRRPLFYAADAGNGLAVRKLLKLGADASHMTFSQRRMFGVEERDETGSGLLCVPTPTTLKGRACSR